MPIKRGLFEMLVDKIGLVEGVASVLVCQWIMNAALKYAVLIEMTKVAEV
jgi:hypothetical protein